MMKLRIGSKVEVLNNTVFPGMWMCGEIVAVDGGEITEVLDGGNWKTAVILEAMGEEYYRIRLAGSLEDLEVHGSSLRFRHAWEEDKWFVLGRFSELRTETIDGLTLLGARES